MERAGGLDARARRAPSGRLDRFHEHLADAVATVGLIDHEGCDPAPGATVVRHRHEEVCRGSDERQAVVGDEDIGPRVGEHVLEPIAECVRGLRMTQLVEQASQLIGILGASRANRHSNHLG